MAFKQNSKFGKKLIKNARNVLALPKEYFWPLLGEEDEVTMNFKESIKCIKTIRPKFKWSEHKKLSKEERKSKIEAYFQTIPKDALEFHKKAMELRKIVSLGVNDVCRALEKEELACCLICGDAKPKLLVTHLLDLAKGKKIPILVLNSLKALMLGSVGFSSLAVGFKKEILADPSNELYNTCTRIMNIFSEKYGYNSEVISDLESNFEPPCFFEEDSIANGNEHSQPALKLEDIYLYRDSTNYRVFKPNQCTDTYAGKSVSPDAEMIVIDYAEEEMTGVVNKKSRYFKPPVVLRVQANPHKIRKQKKKKKS